MADLQKTIELLFKGDDQASSVIRSVTGHLDDFGSKVSGLNQSAADFTAPFANVAESALTAEAAIAATGAAMVALAVNQAGQFSDSFNEIATLVDTTDVNLESFKGNVLAYSRDSSFAFEQINDAVYQAISFGADYEDSLAAVAIAEKLAIGGKAGLSSATELLSGTLNAYGEGVDAAGKYSDIFFTVVKDGKTTIPELATNLSKVTGIASAASIPMGDLGAAIAAITATGAPTSETITSLKAVISNIIKPTKEASAAAALLGISFGATALETKGLDGLLKDVYLTTGGNVEQMGKLFGSTEALNAALILGADSSGKFAKAMADMEKATGATDAAYKKMADNIGLANQNMINNARATMIEFGTPLLGSYRDLADGIVEIFKGLSISIDAGAFDPVFNELNAQAAKSAKFLEDMAKALPAAMKGVDLKGLLDSFRDLGQSIAGLFDGVDLTSAEGLKRAVQAVVDAVEGLTRFSSGIVEGAEPIIKMVLDWAQSFNDMDDSAKKSAGEMTGFLAAINQLTGPLDAVFSSLGGVTSALNLFAGSSLVRAVTGLIGPGGLSTAFTATGTAASALALPALAAVAAIAGVGAAILAYQEKVSLDTAAEKELQDSLQRGGVAREELAKKYEKISTLTGIFIGDSQNLHKEIEAGTIALNKQTGEWEKVVTVEEKFAKQTRLAAAAGMDWSDKNRSLVDEFGNLYGTVDKTTAVIDKHCQEVIDTATAYYELQGNTPEVARAMAALEPNISKATTALKKVETQTAATTLKLLDLASNERIRSMELSVDIKIANIEAETKKVEAMFSSIDNTITQTSSNIGTLFGQLTNTSNFGDKWAIQDQLKKENDLRDKAAKDQHDLDVLQMENLRRRNKQMQEGGGLINITAGGLEPEIEAFMFKIIERVQVRVNESAAEFLLVT